MGGNQFPGRGASQPDVNSTEPLNPAQATGKRASPGPPSQPPSLQQHPPPHGATLTLQPGHFSFSFLAIPVMVPPVPAEATSMSSFPGGGRTFSGHGSARPPLFNDHWWKYTQAKVGPWDKHRPSLPPSVATVPKAEAAVCPVTLAFKPPMTTNVAESTRMGHSWAANSLAEVSCQWCTFLGCLILI